MIRFVFEAREDSAWRKRGETVFFEQIELSRAQGSERKAAPSGRRKITLRETPDRIVVTGESFEYRISKETGLPEAMELNGKELLKAPVQWNLWRAPTDNDSPFRRQWERFHLDALIPRVYETASKLDQGVAEINVKASLGWQSHFPLMRLHYRITVDEDGAMDICIQARVADNRPPLPRFGLRLRMPGDMEHAEYWGYGPYESYADKHEATWWGRFSEKADDNREKHIRPQESGAHMGCTRLIVTGERCGLRITAKEPFAFRLTHYSQENETAAGHRDELQPEEDAWLCLDRAQAGIGTGSCGPVPAPEYLLKQKEINWCFHLEPFSA